MKPYQVWVKQDNINWRCVFDTHNPRDAHEYAIQNIAHGNNVERIEIRDLTGTLETCYDRGWFFPPDREPRTGAGSLD